MAQISRELIEQLLWEEESPTLDFKGAQYPFANASDDEKSELLKDMLAFANAHRRDDAFILVGVKSLPGGRSQIVGVNEQLDDAHIQQFINSKTQRPLTFSYKAIDIDGLPIAVLHIPKQKRPFYATSQFGKVNKGAVYVRRGSSTAIAMPDEIAAMGTDQITAHAIEPVLTFATADRMTGQAVGATIPLNCVALEVPPRQSIPKYRKPDDLFSAAIYHANENYYRDLASYTRTRWLVRRVAFAVVNAGDVTALDVRVLIDVPDPDGVYTFMAPKDLPGVPEKESNFIALHEPLRPRSRPSTSIQKLSSGWRIECLFGKVQPKDTVLLSDDLSVGSTESGELPLDAKIYADNLSSPLSGIVKIDFKVIKRSVTMDEINALEFDRFSKSQKRRELLDESDPGGHLNFPHPWPGQTPPPGDGGTRDDYAV